MSDIWNEFEKLAVAQGLISLSEDDEPKKTPARYDSLADDAIRLLYNIEPDLEKRKSIIEVAHPETSVVGRAYDAMNAIVENELQRHDVMTYISQKMPNGHLTQRRYVEAKKDLLDSLIRSAFTLDNHDEESLMVLADSCAEKIGDRNIKTASPAVVAAVGAAAAALGLGYYFFFGAPPAEGVYQNCKKVLLALEPLADKKYANAIKTDITTLMNMAKQVYAVKQQLIPIHSVDEAISSAQKDEEKKKSEKANQIVANYITQLLKIQEAIVSWSNSIRVMSSEDTEERSSWSAKLHNITKNLFDTPEEKLIYSLEGKTDAFVALQGMLPGQKVNPGGLYGAILSELGKFQGAVNTAKEKLPEIQTVISQNITENKPVEVASKTPSMADLNKELAQELNVAASRRWR